MGAQTPDEVAWDAQFERDQIMQNGYRIQQATRPQTLSYAMMDSPVGIAAWLVETFHDWSDVPVGGVENAHSNDELLTNVMIYITTRTFNSASWIYYGRREEGGRILSGEGMRVEVPTGSAVFPNVGGRGRLQAVLKAARIIFALSIAIPGSEAVFAGRGGASFFGGISDAGAGGATAGEQIGSTSSCTFSTSVAVS